MKPVWKFRILAFGLAALVGAISVSNLIAEFLRPGRDTFLSTISRSPTAEQLSAARQAAAISPFRHDLKAEYALLLTGDALNTKGERLSAADAALRDALRIGPHNSEAWLGLALLQAQISPNDP